MSQHYDVIVIGGGPGGYGAAIRASELSLSVLLVDEQTNPENDDAPALGGTCANVGCIPSKALLSSSHAYELTTQEHGEFAYLGLHVPKSSVSMNMQVMHRHRIDCVVASNQGVLRLLSKYRVSFLHGYAQFSGETPDGWALIVNTHNENKTVIGKHVIIACGTRPRALAGCPFDEKVILSNTGALKLADVPHRLGIVGAGVVGLELGTVWRRLGATVQILEAQTSLLPMADDEIRKFATASFLEQGLDIQLGVSVEHVRPAENAVEVVFTDSDGHKHQVIYDKLLVAIGRTPVTDRLNAQSVGLELLPNGQIQVDDLCRTNLKNVWAIGDIVRGPQLAHKAQDEGIAVAERIAEGAYPIHLERIPAVIYTVPEIAWVGMTLRQAIDSGIDAISAQASFAANGRARAGAQTHGFVRLVANRRNGKILGVHIAGGPASELIGEASAILAFGATLEDVSLVCHAHPTFHEALREAARHARGESVNS